MEYNFDLRRILFFVVLLGVFAFFGGFSMPEQPMGSLHDGASVRKAWFYCMILFVIGAGAASFIDHWAGTMEPVNYRSLYIILGALLMGASALWLRSLKETVASQNTVASANLPPALEIQRYTHGG